LNYTSKRPTKCFLVFLIGFILRLVPEILASSYYIGFDVITYHIPLILSWAKGEFNLTNVLQCGDPLYHLITFTFYYVSKNFSFLKILNSLLYGALCLSFFSYTVKGLNWGEKKGVLVTLLFSFYFVSLRVAWDLHENELSLVFLLILLPYLQKFNEIGFRSRLVTSILTILIVLSHQLVSLIMFFIAFMSIITQNLKSEKRTKYALLNFTWFVPSLIIFIIIARFTGTWTLNYSEYASSFGISYLSYEYLIRDVFSFLLFCYGPLLPFVLLNFKDERKLPLTLDLWMIVCLGGTVWPLFFPNFGIGPWYRWALMLEIPLILYAASNNNNRIKFHILKKRILCIFLIVGLGYTLMPPEFPFPYFLIDQRLLQYGPSSMLSNTVSINDFKDVEKVLKYVNNDLESNQSVLLVHEAFFGWTKLYLNRKTNFICYYFSSPIQGAETALSQNYTQIYLIWWVNGYGWYGQPTVPESFQELYRSNKIAIYEYVFNR